MLKKRCNAFPTKQPQTRKSVLPPNRRKHLQNNVWDSNAEIDLLRHYCRANFWTFFAYGFGAFQNPKGEKWIEESVHKPLADWFEGHVLDWYLKRTAGKGEQKHLAILVHREVGKTTMISQAGQAWLHVLDPELSSYTGSERTELSQKIIAAIKAVFDGSDPYALFPKLYGNWSTAARSWTGKEIVHSARRNTARKDPSLGTFAVETSIVGAHPDAIFYDDPISYERLASDTNWLATVNSQLTSLFPVLQSDGLMVWVGTRYDDEDHFGVAFRDEGISSCSGMGTDSLTVTEDGKWHVYFLAGRDNDKTPDHPKGKPTTPKVWPERRLVDYERRDTLRYASQVMNDPQLSQMNPITREQLSQYWIEESRVPWSAMRYAILTDTAFFDGGKLQGKDETTFYIIGFPRDGSGMVYAIEGDGSPRWSGEEFSRQLIVKVQQYRRQGKKVFAITDEKTRAGKAGAWRDHLTSDFHDVREPMPMFIEFERGDTDKATRLVVAANYIADGFVRFVKNGPGLDRLHEQLSRIGQYMVNRRLKIDRADAFSDAFQPEGYSRGRKVPFYIPRGRQEQGTAPWDRGTQVMEGAGITRDMFDEDYQPPRPVLR